MISHDFAHNIYNPQADFIPHSYNTYWFHPACKHKLIFPHMLCTNWLHTTCNAQTGLKPSVMFICPSSQTLHFGTSSSERAKSSKYSLMVIACQAHPFFFGFKLWYKCSPDQTHSQIRVQISLHFNYNTRLCSTRCKVKYAGSLPHQIHDRILELVTLVETVTRITITVGTVTSWNKTLKNFCWNFCI